MTCNCKRWWFRKYNHSICFKDADTSDSICQRTYIGRTTLKEPVNHPLTGWSYLAVQKAIPLCVTDSMKSLLDSPRTPIDLGGNTIYGLHPLFHGPFYSVSSVTPLRTLGPQTSKEGGALGEGKSFGWGIVARKNGARKGEGRGWGRGLGRSVCGSLRRCWRGEWEQVVWCWK